MLQITLTEQQATELARLAGTLRIKPEIMVKLILSAWMDTEHLNIEEEWQEMATMERKTRSGWEPEWRKVWV